MDNIKEFNNLVGKLLDKRYKIEKCLGTGGMSVVFKATDIADGATVAIKMLRDEIADDKEASALKSPLSTPLFSSSILPYLWGKVKKNESKIFQIAEKSREYFKKTLDKR